MKEENIPNKGGLTQRQADPPSALVCGVIFAQFFQGKIGLCSSNRRAASVMGILSRVATEQTWRVERQFQAPYSSGK
ncbi:MAG: hypothetical protein B6I38_07010 [Anaerolineaceae bacterium 4572_5.1]|nr:MAG: hypothetical protein B6I38_07010 [Anaerolineaceae bacterium 4572_5.1]